MKITTADGVEVDVVEPIGTAVIDAVHTRTNDLLLILCFVHEDETVHGYQLTATRAMQLVEQIIQFGRDHSEPPEDADGE